MYHRLLQEQMEKVERGEEPMALIRDKAENEPMIALNRERNRYSAFNVQYPNYFEKGGLPVVYTSPEKSGIT
jgi:hypothetical protein